VPLTTSPNLQLLERIRAEYLEMPGLMLRAVQVQRLCGIEQTMCALVLTTLVETKFLRLTLAGTYARMTDGEMPRGAAAQPLR
jgi:hypothetical protein